MSDVDPGELASYRVCKYLVQAIVEHPDEVKVKVDDGGSRRQLEVSVADGDMGRVIGKRGRTAHAIRALVRAAAAREGTSVDVEFVD